MTRRPNNELIRLDDVEVSYPLKGKAGRDGAKKTVLKDVNLKIQSGDFITVVGPSGCGKSTVLRMALGSQQPTRGSVSIAGQPVRHVTRECGIVYQKYSLFPQLSVLDNIAFGLLLEETNLIQGTLRTPKLRVVRKEAYEQAYALIDEIGLERSDADKHPHELSGGMRQRVAIAQALIMKPKVLLMDEPFGALDHSTRADMQAFIMEEWKRHGLTVLFVTHDLDEALLLGSRLIALSQYWSHSNGESGDHAQIVADIDLDKELPGVYPRPHEAKFSAEFQRLKQKVELEALNPKHRQHLSRFSRRAVEGRL